MKNLLPYPFIAKCGFTVFMLLLTRSAIGQPVNDDCSGALEIIVAKNETAAVQVDGDTRGATASTAPLSVCSGSFYTDDVWFRFSTADTLPRKGFIAKVYFDPIINATDLPYIGMAIYESCDSLAKPIHCFSEVDPKKNFQFISSGCLFTSSDYYIRLWSGGNTTNEEGTFSIVVYEDSETKQPVWWETFDGGIENNGWTTSGSCQNPDSNHNANWQYLPDGLIDKGAFIFQGAGINSETTCDGAVGVDSDYLNNYGNENSPFGPCDSPSRHYLVSPEIDTRTWNREAVYISWNQAIRNFQSTFYLAFRTREDGGDWNTWDSIQINREFPINGDFENDDVQTHFINDIANHDFLQLMFIYHANFYMWVIDDVKLLTTEDYYDLKIKEDAIAPWYSVPSNQSYPYYSSIAVANASYEPHTNIILSHLIRDQSTGDTAYFNQVNVDTIKYDSLNIFRFFPPVIDITQYGEYSEEFSVIEENTDSQPLDNKTINTFAIGGNYFAHENGYTRAVAPSAGLYFIAAPLSYGYGNIFKIQKDVIIGSMVWGVNNTTDMVGKTVSLYVIEWNDLNKDQRAQVAERTYIAYADYEFTGEENDNALINSTLENFDNPGNEVMLKGGRQYMAMVVYQATSGDDPQFFLLASDARDYSGVVATSDIAYQNGLIESPIYMTVLQFSPDGNINDIDFEVRELNTNDPFIHFSDAIVPLIRLGITILDTDDPLKAEFTPILFPNPVRDELTIQMTLPVLYPFIKLKIADVAGRIYVEEQINYPSLDFSKVMRTSTLLPGQYFLTIETERAEKSLPFSVVR